MSYHLRFHTALRLILLLTSFVAAATLPRATLAQAPARAYFTAAPDSAATYTLTRRQGAGGTITTYRPDGRRLHQETYANLASGQLHGPSTTWTAGRRTAVYFYRYGQLHGLAQAWYPNGRRRWQLSYTQGQRHGPLRAWYPSGQPRRLETYRHGQRVSGRCFTRTGQDTAYFAFSRPASFAGGPDSLRRWLGRQLRYPAWALRNQVEVLLRVRFRVDARGRVQEPVVVRDLEPIITEEVLRVLRRMPPWLPAVQEGQAVSVEYELPVEFTIR